MHTNGLTKMIDKAVLDVANEANRREELLLQLTADVAVAAIGKGHIPAGDIPNLLSSIHGALSGLGGARATSVDAAPRPAVPVKKSIQDDFIICLEDGKKFKSLKRHIGTHYNLTPEEYRAKWGLPEDYPMVAPNYAAARSQLAKQMGLGRKPGARVTGNRVQ